LVVQNTKPKRHFILEETWKWPTQVKTCIKTISCYN
jgi:hypothetical protein